MEPEAIELLDPTMQPTRKQAFSAPDLPKLDKKLNISFFWNSKPNGDLLLLNIKERLKQKYPQLVMSWFQKESSSAAANISIINLVSAQTELVVIATAD